MSKLGRYTCYGPAQMTGFWQPLDLWMNGMMDKLLGIVQARQEMGGFCEARTSGGHLKAPDMYAAALAQHYCLDEVSENIPP